MSGLFTGYSTGASMSGVGLFFPYPNDANFGQHSVPFGYGYTGQDVAGLSLQGPIQDPVPSVLMVRSMVHLGFLPTHRTIGFEDSYFSYDRLDQYSTRVEGTAPVASRYDKRDDAAFFGSAVNQRYMGVGLAKSRFSRDRNVRHSAYRGTVLPSYRSGYYVPDGNSVQLGSLQFPTVKCASPFTAYQIPMYQCIISGYPGSVSFSTNENRQNNVFDCPETFFSEVLGVIQDNESWQFATALTELPSNHWLLNYHVTDVEFSIDYVAMVLRLTYRLTLDLSDSDQTSGTVAWDIEMYLGIGWHERHLVLTGNGIAGNGALDPISSYAWRPVYNDVTGPNGTSSVHQMSSGIVHDFMECIYTDAHLGGLSNDVDKLVNFEPHERARKYQLAVTPLLSEVRKTSFYSTADATEKVVKYLKSVNLETLTDLPEILELVPDVTLLLRVLLDLKAGRLSALKGLGDLIAGTYLKYEFGIAPTAATVSELNAKGGGLIAAIDDTLLGVKTSYGKFQYTFTDDVLGSHFPGDLRLTTRTKMKLSASTSGLVLSLIGAYESGLVPSLSQVWEVLPGSFVVDWFVNLRRRFKDIDTRALMLAFDIQLLEHSFLLELPVSVDALSAFELTSDGNDPFTHRYYWRALSRYVPNPVESRFDFRSPTYSPSYGIVGSLLWVLLT